MAEKVTFTLFDPRHRHAYDDTNAWATSADRLATSFCRQCTLCLCRRALLYYTIFTYRVLATAYILYSARVRHWRDPRRHWWWIYNHSWRRRSRGLSNSCVYVTSCCLASPDAAPANVRRKKPVWRLLTPVADDASPPPAGPLLEPLLDPNNPAMSEPVPALLSPPSPPFPPAYMYIIFFFKLLYTL